MRKQIYCDTPNRRVRIAWVSFQPDGSISFGLNDRTYISPRFRARHFVWNAYNRVRIRYEVPSDRTTLETVKNPHFTFHPALWFHLKADGPSGDDALFEATADVGLTLEQHLEMPWVRSVSAPIATLPTSGWRAGDIAIDELSIRVPSERFSVAVALDFVKPQAGEGLDHQSRWFIAWHNVAIRITLSFTYPQIATCSWFHFS